MQKERGGKGPAERVQTSEREASFSTGKSPQGRPRTRCRDYISPLAWERLEVQEMLKVSGGWPHTSMGGLRFPSDFSGLRLLAVLSSRCSCEFRSLLQLL